MNTVSNKLRKELNKKLGRRRFVMNLLVVFAFVFSTIFLGMYGGIQSDAKQQVFAGDVLIDGIQVGGLSFAEAEKLVGAHEKQYLDSISQTVVYEGQSKVFDAAALGVTTDVANILKQAYEYDKKGATPFDNFERAHEAQELKSSLVINENDMYDNLKQAFSGSEVAPVDATAEYQKATGDFKYTDGSEGRGVDIDQLCRDISTSLNSGSKEPITASTKILLPQFTRKDLEENSQLIGEYKTTAGEDADRALNMQLMCGALNGTVVQPGEEISLIDISGGITPEKGYVEASVEEDGKKQGSEMGGGVCQFASTFYNAALLADMGVVERQKNLWPPAYVKVGLDAQLNFDDTDLKMKNRSNYPIYIGASLSAGVLKIDIFGQPLKNKIEIESRELDYIEAPHAEVVYTEDYPEGEQHEKSKSREGYEVEVFRHYLENGRTVSSEQISHDKYNEIRGVIMQGTGN